VEAGGLISYGPCLATMWAKLRPSCSRSSRASSPAICRSSNPTKFELVVNLTTAKALSLTIPGTFLLRADGVIE
jgi:putative tryptophan/tyrosine transport system substrate-binding protein